MLYQSAGQRSAKSPVSVANSARRLEPAPSEATADTTEVRLREKGTDKVHIYEAWAWEEEAPDDAPEWLEGQGTITEANVSKEGIKHLEE